MINSANIPLNIMQPGNSSAGGNTYKDLVIAYWNWLLGPDADSPVQTVSQDRILFMRTPYEYSFHTNAYDNTLHRQNSQSSHHPNGPPQVTVDQGVDTNTYIFIPVIDACFHSGYKNIDGSNISPKQMREFARHDISQTVGYIPRPPTIKEATPDGEEQPIVNNMQQFLTEVPQEEGETFELKVPTNSKLADKVEDSTTQTRGSDFDAVAVGYYTAFQIANPGTYIIQSTAQGPRQFLSRMNYKVTVR
jgi:hypothetical protein